MIHRPHRKTPTASDGMTPEMRTHCRPANLLWNALCSNASSPEGLLILLGVCASDFLGLRSDEHGEKHINPVRTNNQLNIVTEANT